MKIVFWKIKERCLYFLFLKPYLMSPSVQSQSLILHNYGRNIWLACPVIVYQFKQLRLHLLFQKQPAEVFKISKNSFFCRTPPKNCFFLLLSSNNLFTGGQQKYGAHSVPKPFRWNKFLIYKKIFLKTISTFINK